MKTILVVDDELSNAEVLALILEDEGYRVFTAVNGRHGLERVHDVRPDLVLLDFMMPVMDGARLGRAIRSDARLATLPIVMTTSAEEARVRESFDDYDAYLRKPFGGRQLMPLLRALLERGRPPRAAAPAEPGPGPAR